MKDSWITALPEKPELMYVTVVCDDGRRTVIKARYLEDEKIHKRMEFRVPRPEHRWKGPGWYATGDQLGMGVYEIGALFRILRRVVAYMAIPGVPEPYNGEI